MEVAFTECIPVTDSTSVSEVRRSAALAAARLGLNETRTGELALLATEVSRNVLIHGGGGEVIVAGLQNNMGPLARILAMDKGAGIENVPRAMSDGFSTAGSMGGGLGAMKRLANHFEIFTGRGGTIVLLELGNDGAANRVQVAGMVLPYPGERFCGDGWYCEQTPDRTIALLADGLGHGLGAADAAQEAIATFRRRIAASPAALLGYIHDALKKTRGAVAAIAEISPQQGSITYAGIGNISASVIDGNSSRSLISHNGTLGGTIHRIQEFSMQWRPGSVLVMHSDGLQTRWDLSSYAGLASRHPALIGGVLIRDFRRQRDDAGVVVLKAA